jgi:hypothetical protein
MKSSSEALVPRHGTMLNFGDHNYGAVNKKKMKIVAGNILDIPPAHLRAIDELLEDIKTYQASNVPMQIKVDRSAKLTQCIDDKLLLKKLLSVACECVDCELETMSLLQYDLLQQVVEEESKLHSHALATRTSLTRIEQRNATQPLENNNIS